MTTYHSSFLLPSSCLTVSLLFHVVLLEVLFELFQEDERQNGVRSQTEEVGRESLPQSEHSLRTDKLGHTVHCSVVFTSPSH